MTVVSFVPLSQSPPFQFQPVLDGDQYSLIVFWNIFGQRWYFSLYDGSNNRVTTMPLVASSDGYNINLVGGYFTISTLVFRASSQSFEVNP